MSDELKEWDLRTDVYTPAIPAREDYPPSWPSVKVVHIPTGLVEMDQSTPSQLRNRLAAIGRLTDRVRLRSTTPGD